MNELVLIVEDEQDVAQLLRYNLQKAGYRTVVAYDGDQALSVTRFSKPDLVLLDLMLPERDGWDVCRRIRASELADTPIIMLSALDSEDFRLRGLQTGADDYISKPFSVREILLRVRKLLDRSAEIRSQRLRSTETETQLSYLVHELKNNVSVIGGYAHLAGERTAGGEYLKRISRTAVHMEQLLSDASLIVRLESGTALPLEPLELVDIVQESIDALRDAPDAGGERIQLVGAPSLRVWGNRQAIRQIVTNLVSNALKYNRVNGFVWVRIEEREEEIDLAVRDEGPGVPFEERMRVFEKFYRCPATAHVKGAGLGLYVVRLLAQGMGGSARVISDRAGGSTFIVTLRKTNDAAAALPLAAS